MCGLLEEILIDRALGHPNNQNLNSLKEKGRNLREWGNWLRPGKYQLRLWETQLTLSVGEGVGGLPT